MIISRINPFKIYKNNNKPTQRQNSPILPSLAFDTVSFSGKKKPQLIGKYDQNQVVKRLMKKGAPQESIHSILENPRKKQALAKFIEDWEKGKIKFSRTPREREVVFAIDLEFDYKKLQKFIEWQDNIKENKTIFSRPLKTKEALAAIDCNANEAQIQRALTLSDKDEKGNTYLSQAITFREGLDAALSNYTDEQAEVYFTLKKNNVFSYRSITENPEKYSKLIELTKTTTYGRPLTTIEAAGVIERKFTKEQIEKFIRLKDHGVKNPQELGKGIAKQLTEQQIWVIASNNLNDFQTYYFLKYESEYGFLQIIRDEKLLKKFLNLTGEYGKPETTRTMTFEEAKHIFAFGKDLSKEQLQKYIDLIDKQCSLFTAGNLVTNFWNYRNVSNIKELNNEEKRELLNKIMAESTSIFTSKLNSKDFPLVPKSQEEYCAIVPKLANSIGMEIKALSERELKAFNTSLENLIKKIPNINLDKKPKEIKKDLENVLIGISESKKTQQDSTSIQNNLKLLQDITKNQDFQRLNIKDQKTLTIAILLHNLNKSENNPNASYNSAFNAFYIIQKLNLDEEEQLKIYEIIKNQNWQENFKEENIRKNPRIKWCFESENYSKEEKNKIINTEIKKIAQDIAFETRHGNTFELTKILSRAILESEGKNLNEFNIHLKEIEKYIDHIKKTQIFLPQAKFPKASQIKNGEIMSENEIKNTVLDLDKCDFNLEKYGFEKGTTKDNLYMLVHGLDRADQLSNFSTFSIIDTEALLSTSYMKPANHKVFRQQGIILDVHSNDIHAGFFKDFGSGTKKTLEVAKKEYIFPETNAGFFNRSEYRTYISDLIKKKLNLNDKNYVELIEKIQNLKSWTTIQKFDPKVANVLKTIFDEMEMGKRRYGRQYNEFLVSKPKIQAIFSYGQDYEKIPTFLKKFAMDNDLPIILLGE